MTLYITEREMIGRYVDGLRQASSRAKEMMTSEESKKPLIFTEFLHGIKVAAGSAHQLAHSQPDKGTRWLKTRDLLEAILELGQTLPTFGGREKNGLWLSIKQSLDGMADQGQRLFAQKALDKATLNFELDQRLKNAPELVNNV